MDNYSDVTRLLCSCAILKGRAFRQTLLDHYQNKHIASAPEIGLDMKLLMKVVCKVEELEAERVSIRRLYGWGFLALAIIGSGTFLVSRNPLITILIMLIPGFALQWVQLNAQDKFDPETLLDDFRLRNYDPERIAEKYKTVHIERKIEDGLPHPEQNVVTYSGFTPFIGAGDNRLKRWSFAINVTHGKENELGSYKDPLPFEVAGIYEHIEEQLSNLNFPGMTVQDMLFVNGQDIRNNRQILSSIYDRPIQHLNEQDASQYMTSSDLSIRHYKWIQIHYGNEALVVSFFLRFSLRGNNLFSEYTTYLLTPLAEEYRELDISRKEIEKTHWYTPILKFIGKIIVRIILVPFSLLMGIFLPAELVSEFIGKIFDKSEEKREEAIMEEIEQNPLYDWGANSSVRQLVSNHHFERYFQMLDEDMYNKIIERTILDSIVEFLEEHNINVSDIRERRTTILNSGVIVQGGDVNADVLAVGEGAQAQQSNTPATMREAS